MLSAPWQTRRTTRDRSNEAMLVLLEQRGIHDRCVLAALTQVAREPFATSLQPYDVALMLQALDLKGHERVLEIGTGSGYSAAVLSQLALQVDTIERDPTLATAARARLAALRYDGIEVACGDGTLGWPEHAPYDAIIVAAGGPSVPRALVDQLVVGGRLVMPIGSRESQYLALVTKTGDHAFEVRDLGAVAFVPLVGAYGWAEVA